ncbi:MAG: hypothetical protein ACM3XO_05495 [Bacteroidota bacterium]|jgi:hypothetical protein
MAGPEINFESEESRVTNLSQTQVENVNAQQVNMTQSAAEKISAENVTLDKSAVGDLTATHVQANQAAIGELNASDVVADQSLIGYVQAERAGVSGFTGAVIAQSADVRSSASVAVIANDVNFEESARTVLLISRNVQGNVTTLADTRTALIAGLVAGLFASIAMLLGRALFSRR